MKVLIPCIPFLGSMKIPIGTKDLDELLNGGIESGALTLLYGEAGSGKTNICLQLARNVARKGRRTVFIDTEGVSFERLRQMCGEDFDQVVQKILFYNPYSFEEQEKLLDEAIKLTSEAKDIKLVLLDSITVYFRLKKGESDQGHSSLSYQIIRLLTLARKHDISVVLTSQVYFDIENQILRPLGGHTLYHNAKTILLLEKVDPRTRKATIIKHRNIHEGESAMFLLTANGVE